MANSPKPQYQSEDLGLLIAFTTLPLDNAQKFLDDQIVKIFNHYKSGITAIARHGVADLNGGQEPHPEDETYNARFFKPVSYVCFGKFDVAHLSLVDDLEFATRVFRPYNPLASDQTLGQEKFDFQVIFGPNGGPNTSPKLEQKAINTFLKDSEKYPYIAICQFKVNNSLLLGGGASLILSIQQLIEKKISFYKDSEPYVSIEQKGQPDEMRSQCEFILTESFSYQELVLVLFGNCYDQLSKLILMIRELKFQDLKQSDTGGFMSDDAFSKLSKSTLAHKLFDSDKETIKQGINSNHLFNSTVTVLGYHFDLYDRQSQKPNQSKQEKSSFLKEMGQDVRLKTNWFVKPGHLTDLKDALEKIAKKIDLTPLDSAKINALSPTSDLKFELTVGKGDLHYPTHQNESLHPISIKTGMDFVEQVFENREVTDHILESVSYPTIALGTDFLESLGKTQHDQHYQINPHLDKLAIRSSENNEIKRKLKALGMPSVLLEKITTIISAFNNGIQDRLLYGSFWELHNFVEYVLIGTINNYYNGRDRPEFNKSHAEDVLFALTEAFEVGYRNRLMHTYWSSDRYEYNLDYRGGIQVILSAWDVAYKALSKPLGEHGHTCSFVYVSGFSGVVSLEYALKLNYYHIFLPSIYLCIAGHEAANHYLNKLLSQEAAEHVPEAFSVNVLSKFFAQAGIKPQVFLVNLPKHKSKTTLLYGAEVGNFFLEEANLAGMEPFLLLLKPEFYRYLIVDTITYYYCFNGDAELFWHYSWAYLLQMARAYAKPSVLDKQLFRLMLMRLVFVLQAFEPTFFEKKILPPSEILADYWITDFGKCLQFAEMMIDGSDVLLRNWLDYFQGLAAKVVFDMHEEPNSEYMDPEQRKLTEAAKSRLHELNQLDIHGGKKFAKSIKRGTPPGIDVKDQPSGKGFGATRHVSKLVYGYLHLIHDEFIKDKDGPKEIVLHRFQDFGTVWINKKVSAKLLLDPFGGYFTHDIAVRREFFLYRTTLIKSLWNLSMVEKGEIIFEKISSQMEKDTPPKKTEG